MSDASDKTGNLAQAMEHAKQLLDHDLQQAALQLEEILAAVPELCASALSESGGIGAAAAGRASDSGVGESGGARR